MTSQEIKCNVTTCRHNNDTLHCSLDSIVVGNNNTNAAHNKHDTECVSFETR